MASTSLRYEDLRQAFRGKWVPLAFVDRQAFDANVAYVADRALGTGKTVRLATKSICCEPLLRRVLQTGPGFQGLLTYTVEETKFLADVGHDDLLVAYPTVQPTDLEPSTRLTGEGKRGLIMVDSPAHRAALDAAETGAGMTRSVCLEADLANRPLPGLQLGLRRSPIRTPR
jgi:D-serine deaminase-like pyridoxal phosphate-dependent protein